MRLPVQVEPLAGMTPDVDYRWDPDTDILSARVRAGSVAERPVGISVPAGQPPGDAPELPRQFGPEAFLSGAVELEGRDGSWIVLDVESGHLAGVEVAVWPNVRRRSVLLPPADVQDAQVRVTGRRRRGPRGTDGAAAVEVTTSVTAEADAAERTIHFCLGPRRTARAVRLARDLLVDVDAEGHLAGLWLLNVPPVPPVT
jgi:hypothetical protein